MPFFGLASYSKGRRSFTVTVTVPNVKESERIYLIARTATEMSARLDVRFSRMRIARSGALKAKPCSDEEKIPRKRVLGNPLNGESQKYCSQELSFEISKKNQRGKETGGRLKDLQCANPFPHE